MSVCVCRECEAEAGAGPQVAREQPDVGQLVRPREGSIDRN